MTTTTRRRGRAVSGLLVAALAFGGTLVGIPGVASTPSVSAAPVGAVQEGGPVILDGTDSGLHGSIQLSGGAPDASELRSTWGYMLKAWETLLAGVPSSYAHNGKVAVVGATDSTATSNNCGAAAHYIAERLATGTVTVDYFEGATAIGQLFDDVLTGDANYKMIQIVEDDKWCGNGMALSESVVVDARGPAISAHVNRGGALFAQSQPYGWLSSLFPNLTAQFSGCSGSTPNLTDAGYAQFPGLTNSDIAAPWHNCFTTTGDFPLTPLALQDGLHTVILGGESVTLPSTVTLTTVPEQPRPGEEVCTTATVVDSSGNPVEGASVEFFVDDISVGTQITDASGVAEYCYTTATSGEDKVEATVTTGPGTGNNSTTITTSTLSLAASPSATLERDATVCIDVVAATSDGVTETPIDGGTIDFSIDGPNGPASGSDVTDASGNAQYCYTGANGGTDTVTATIAGDGSTDSREILVNWSGAFVNIVDVEQDANGTGKVVPVTIDEFAAGTLYATVSIPVGEGTLSLNTSGFTVALTPPASSFTNQTELAFEGSVANITGLLASRLTWDAPGDAGVTTITVTVADDPTNPVQTATDIGSLSVTTPPVITKQPETQTVDAGTTIMLHAHSTGVPTPVAQWQVSTDDGATWTNVPGGEAGHFSLPVTNEMDGSWYRARISNSSGNVTSDIAVLTVNPMIAPTVTYDGLGDIEQGAAIVATTPVVTGAPAPTFSVTTGSLPTGLSLDENTGVISGTPTVVGPYSFTVTATNAAGTDAVDFSGNVTPAPVAPSFPADPLPELETLQVGEPFGATIEVAGVPAPTFSVTAGSLPAGLTLDPTTGLISGTPTVAGPYSFTVRATSTSGSDAHQFSGTVALAPVAPSFPADPLPELETLQVGEPFGATIEVAGVPAPTFSVTAGSLPAGLTLDPTTGLISGTPTVAGPYSFTVRATSTSGSDAHKFSGTVALAETAPEPEVDVTPPTRPDAPVVIRGGGFVPGTTVEVIVDGEVVTTAVADENGDVDVTIPAPDGPRYSIGLRSEGDEEAVTSRRVITGFDGKLATVPQNSGYVPLVPNRVLDTRESGERLGAGETYRLAVEPDWNVPASATTVALNVTATRGAGEGFLTVFPCGGDMPLASAVNYVPGSDTPNLSLVAPGENDEICIYSQWDVDLVVDLNGYFADDVEGRLASVTPVRLVDTRDGDPIPAGEPVEVQVTGGELALNTSNAAVVNVVAVNAGSVGYLTLFPCDQKMPLASNINYEPGSTNAGQAYIKLSPSGTVCVYSPVEVDIVIDLNASFIPGDAAQLMSNVPTRVLDTRETGALAAGDVIKLALGGSDGVEGATAFAVNLTATESRGEGFITAYPCLEGLPLASSVNLAPGRSVANHSTAKPDADGNVCIYTSTATHLVVDVEGVYM